MTQPWNQNNPGELYNIIRNANIGLVPIVLFLEENFKFLSLYYNRSLTWSWGSRDETLGHIKTFNLLWVSNLAELVPSHNGASQIAWKSSETDRKSSQTGWFVPDKSYIVEHLPQQQVKVKGRVTWKSQESHALNCIEWT